MNDMKLAVGPLLYYWPRADVLAFYERLRTAPADIVYLGETVCARRHELRLADWLAIGESLADAGKEVVLSTQTLLESKTDVAALKRITDNGRFTVEANDHGALRLLAGRVPFVAGPTLNIYNAATLKIVHELGAVRWVMPFEMKGSDLALILAEHPHLATEVFAYGRMPLAISARCFTARHHNLPKDDCRFKCMNYPDGLDMKTREDASFLVLNGVQTQSAQVYNLLPGLPAMHAMGVKVVRISPQAFGTECIVDQFDAVRRQAAHAAEALAAMQALLPAASCDGFWHGRPGLEQARALAQPVE